MERLQLAETGFEHAYNTISDLTSDLKGVEKELAGMRENARKSEIVSELRSKGYKLLSHGLPLESPEETPEQSDHVIRSFLINSLRYSESDLAKISLPMLTDFQHINRLYNPPAQGLNRSSYSSEVRQNERQRYDFQTGTKSKTV